MPALPSHRLDVHLVPADRTDRAVAEVWSVWEDWVRRGYLTAEGPGPLAGELIPGGFVAARVDDPRAVVLYSNQVGGFQVRCPICGHGLAREFRPPGPTRCPECNGSFEVEDLDCRPPVALGRASIVLMDVASAVVNRVPTGWSVVLRRVG